MHWRDSIRGWQQPLVDSEEAGNHTHLQGGEGGVFPGMSDPIAGQSNLTRALTCTRTAEAPRAAVRGLKRVLAAVSCHVQSGHSSNAAARLPVPFVPELHEVSGRKFGVRVTARKNSPVSHVVLYCGMRREVFVVPS